MGKNKRYLGPYKKDCIPLVEFSGRRFIVLRFKHKIMIKTLAHACLFSKDLNRSLDFYCGALGLRRQFDFMKNGGLFGFYLQINPNQFIEIFKIGAEEANGHQRIHHLCLEVDDLDAMRDALIQRGVKVTEKKMGCDQTWQCWFKGPDGTDIEFHQYTPQSSQFTRKACVVDW